jgi:Bacteriophage Lambda NinG protein
VTPRARKCKVCTEPFIPRQPMQRVCGIDCARAEAVRVREKAERKEDKARRERIKPRADWMKEAQQAFNTYIRLRDQHLPCVSCGRDHQGQWHAGHYLSTGARPELRFEPLNVHKQCQPCNTHLHGNLVNYRTELLKRIGPEAVEWLEGPHEAKKYTVDELKAIKAEYTSKTKELKNV